MIRVAVLGIGLVLAGGPQAAAAASVTVKVTPEGPNLYRITLQTTVSAPLESVWKVLTDFDHHAEILPYMTKSHVTQREKTDVVIEQEGKIRILFWTYTMRVTQRVTLGAYNEETRFRAIAGDFQRLEGRWRLLPWKGKAGPTHLDFNFVIQPRRHVPEWAVRLAARRYLSRMVESVVAHAEGVSR